MSSFAQFAAGMDEADTPLLRELIGYDVACEHSTQFEDDETGLYLFKLLPGSMHWSRQSEFPFALKHGDFKEHHYVLDVGSSWSIFKFALAKRCNGVVCIDNDPEGVRKSQETIDKFKVTNIEQLVADARKLPFKDETFHRVTCLSVLEHVPEDRLQVVKEMQRVLKPGGVLILTFDLTMNDSDVPEGISQAEAIRIMDYLGIKGIQCGKRIIGRDVDGSHITVAMIRWGKPL